ncbi:hypothetical protein HYDPIDRAFT_80012, partial [Hydnomerulius pinastri MD-312]
AFLWDMLSCIPSYLRLMQISRPTLVMLVYHLSRCLIARFLLVDKHCEITAGPIGDCHVSQIAIGACCFISVASSNFLFLARIQAVFHDNKLVRYFFTLFWVTITGLLSMLFTGFHSGPIADTRHCINEGGDEYVAATMVVPLLFDSLVFLSISYKLMAMRRPTERTLSWRTMCSGRALPRLSRAILQGGQQYYLIKLCCNVLMAVLWLTPSVPRAFQTSFTSPAIGLTSSVACRVFRNLKLETFDHSVSDTRQPDVITTNIQMSSESDVSIVDFESLDGSAGKHGDEEVPRKSQRPADRDIEKGEGS